MAPLSTVRADIQPRARQGSRQHARERGRSTSQWLCQLPFCQSAVSLPSCRHHTHNNEVSDISCRNAVRKLLCSGGFGSGVGLRDGSQITLTSTSTPEYTKGSKAGQVSWLTLRSLTRSGRYVKEKYFVKRSGTYASTLAGWQYILLIAFALQAIHAVLRDAAHTARTLSEFGAKDAQQEELGKACRGIMTSAEVSERHRQSRVCRIALIAYS